MTRSLEHLLLKIRAGTVSPGDLATARALAGADERLPAELRDEVFRDAAELAADAAGVLAVLGMDDLGGVLADGILEEVSAFAVDGVDDGWEPIRAVLVDGIRAEAAGVNLVEAVTRRMPVSTFAHGALVGDAVAREAGGVELADVVGGALGWSNVPVADAVRSEAGVADVAPSVSLALSLPHVEVADAVRAEAGSVDVVAGVMSAIGAWRVTPEVPAAAAFIVVPKAANSGSPRWGYAGVALAAVVLFTVVLGRLATPVDGAAVVVGPVFAHMDEVVVEDLQYSADVQVMQTEGDDGAVILLIDEEA